MRTPSRSAVALLSVVIFSSAASGVFGQRGYGGHLDERSRYDCECLETKSTELRRTVDSHLDNYRPSPTQMEVDLRQSLTELMQEAGALKREAYSNPSMPKLYRSFHLVEYWFHDSWGLAVESGYGRSLAPYFNELESHINNLGRMGFRNPRIDPTSRSGSSFGIFGRSNNVPEQPIQPPNRRQPSQPQVQQPPPLYQDPIHPEPTRRPDQPDLGDVLKNLFRRQ